MEKIQGFLKTKKKYEANLWNDQMGFFLITIIFLGVQILNSWKVLAVCTIIEICLLILCWRMERKKYGSVFCSFVHGEILGLIFLVDGWCFIGLMRKPNNYLIIGIVGTILIGILFSENLDIESRLNLLHTEYDIEINTTLREDVNIMCNLSQGIKEDGMAEIFARMSRKGYSPEQIAEMTDTDVREVKALLQRIK